MSKTKYCVSHGLLYVQAVKIVPSCAVLSEGNCRDASKGSTMLKVYVPGGTGIDSSPLAPEPKG